MWISKEFSCETVVFSPVFVTGNNQGLWQLGHKNREIIEKWPYSSELNSPCATFLGIEI